MINVSLHESIIYEAQILTRIQIRYGHGHVDTVKLIINGHGNIYIYIWYHSVGFCSSYILSIVFFSAWLFQPPAYSRTPFDSTMNNTYKEQREAKQIDSDMFLIHRILIRGKCRAYAWTNLCVIVPGVVHRRYTISDYSFILEGTADPWGYSVT